jgi:hypothetical protein
MGWSRVRAWRSLILLVLIAAPRIGAAQSAAASSSSKHAKHSESGSKPGLDPGSVSAGIYRNKSLGLTCSIPAGWVLRSAEMNSQESAISPQGIPGNTGDSKGKVLLAAFSRPPEARGAEVNSSILIAAEPLSSYPEVKDAAQYFEPLTEVAKAQGFVVDEEPYDFTIGTKALVRGDFHKDVATRVMRQSTLVMLVRGYAVSITVIAGSADEVEDLIGGLDFSARGAPMQP